MLLVIDPACCIMLTEVTPTLLKMILWKNTCSMGGSCVQDSSNERILSTRRHCLISWTWLILHSVWYSKGSSKSSRKTPYHVDVSRTDLFWNATFLAVQNTLTNLYPQCFDRAPSTSKVYSHLKRVPLFLVVKQFWAVEEVIWIRKYLTVIYNHDCRWACLRVPACSKRCVLYGAMDRYAIGVLSMKIYFSTCKNGVDSQ